MSVDNDSSLLTSGHLHNLICRANWREYWMLVHPLGGHSYIYPVDWWSEGIDSYSLTPGHSHNLLYGSNSREKWILLQPKSVHPICTLKVRGYRQLVTYPHHATQTTLSVELMIENVRCYSTRQLATLTYLLYTNGRSVVWEDKVNYLPTWPCPRNLSVSRQFKLGDQAF